MKHMFTGDPWYNGQGQQGGVQGMGFRPGPVKVNMVTPMQAVPPTFGNVHAQSPLQQPQQQQIIAQNPTPTPNPINRPQQQRVPMGSKADCPVCNSFGGRR